MEKCVSRFALWGDVATGAPAGGIAPKEQERRAILHKRARQRLFLLRNNSAKNNIYLTHNIKLTFCDHEKARFESIWFSLTSSNLFGKQDGWLRRSTFVLVSRHGFRYCHFSEDHKPKHRTCSGASLFFLFWGAGAFQMPMQLLRSPIGAGV